MRKAVAEMRATKERLEEFLSIKDEKRLSEVHTLMKEYQGREVKLFEKLYQDYGPLVRATATHQGTPKVK